MTNTTCTPPEAQTEPTKPTFSWKPPEKYTPKHDYYADLVMSYSAMTDIINPAAIDCEYGDIRSLDSCLLKQSLRLNELTHKMLEHDQVTYNDGGIRVERLLIALKVQQAFRENYRAGNLAMTQRYLASTRPL